MPDCNGFKFAKNRFQQMFGGWRMLSFDSDDNYALSFKLDQADSSDNVKDFAFLVLV